MYIFVFWSILRTKKINLKKKWICKFFYTTYHPKTDMTTFEIQPHEVDNIIHLCSTRVELLTALLCRSIFALCFCCLMTTNRFLWLS